MQIDLIDTPVADLGESPVWHAASNSVYWADLLTPTIFRYDTLSAECQQWPMPARLGCIALRDDQHLFAAMGDGVYLIPLATMQPEKLVSVIPDGYRMNDGKVDAKGRFWFGSVGPDPHQPDGKFYCMDVDGRVRQVAEGYHIPNGIGWSLDQTTMYHCDSLGRTIFCYDFDLDQGQLSNRRILYRETSESEPDGMAVDAQGRLWVAHWNGWRIDVMLPNGDKEKTIDMPVQRPTSCAFNSDFSQLYVTSCSKGDPGESRLPLASGQLFCLCF